MLYSIWQRVKTKCETLVNIKSELFLTFYY